MTIHYRADKAEVSVDNNKESPEVPCTDDGQPLALEERLDYGSKSWKDVQQDKRKTIQQSALPQCSSARTTLYARDAEAKEERYDRFFLLQHGRQHPAEQRVKGYSESWDGQKVRQEDVWKYRRAHTILSQAEVNNSIKRWTVQKVMQESLTGFSRYYQGIDGAALGFATLYMYDTKEVAKNSRLVSIAEEILDIDGEKLIDYVWREYGGDVQ